MRPKTTNSILDQAERNQIGKHLVTRFSTSASPASSGPARQCFDARRQDILQVLPSSVTQWGKFRIDGGGNTVHAFNLVKRTDDARDATYVRVSLVLPVAAG
jgi:hypothetical protein